MASTGILVAIEGIDGAGKKTQSDALVRRAEDAGYCTRVFTFPRYDDSFFARSISEYLKGRFGGLRATPSEFAALLFAGDRLEGREELVEALATADLVVSDRYVLSNLAHQSARLEDRRQWRAFQEWIGTIEFDIYRVPKPDLTVYLDVPVSVAGSSIAMRRQAHGERHFTEAKKDLHEDDLQYLAACREAYLGLIGSRWSRLWVNVASVRHDGQRRSRDEVSQEIWGHVLPLLCPAHSRA